MISNIKGSWKTTLIGSILIGFAGVYIEGSLYFKSDVNYIVMSILLGGGIGLIFSPDTVFNLLIRKSKEI